MKNKIALLTVVIICSLTRLDSAFAQIGTAFTYQGQLQTASGPAHGLYDFTFALYNAASGGSQTGSTVQTNAVFVTNGLFTVVIDFGSVFSSSTAYWLQIGVRTNGAASFSALSPRQGLTPAPYANTAENLNGTLLASQLTGTLPGGLLSGTYGNSVTLNNPADVFDGNGAGLANVNAAQLNGLTSANFWQTTGNAGTTAGPNFVGTKDVQPLEVHVDGARALRIEPGTNYIPAFPPIPNIIGGSPGNFVVPTSVGNVIAGGGEYAESSTNYITGQNYNAIGGGWNNGITNGYDNVIGGGEYNTVGSFQGGTVPGGAYNVANGSYSFAAGENAQALNDGTFVWADSEGSTFSSSAANQFLVRAQYFGLNRTSPITGADVFDVRSPAGPGAYGGMYLDTAGTNALPFYGYAMNGVAYAWTYLDGSDGNKWKLYNGGTWLTVTPSGLVGVNTTTPNGQLDVESPSTGNGIYVLNGASGGNGIYVTATNGASAYGVWAISDPGYGVVAQSSTGTGLSATSSTGTGIYTSSGGSALTIGGGAIHVTGATTNLTTTSVSTAAFTQVASAANLNGDSTIIYNTLCNGDPNAILIVTPNWNPRNGPAYFWNHTVGVWYDGTHWEIFNEDGTAMPAGPAFNVLIIKN